MIMKTTLLLMLLSTSLFGQLPSHRYFDYPVPNLKYEIKNYTNVLGSNAPMEVNGLLTISQDSIVVSLTGRLKAKIVYTNIERNKLSISGYNNGRKIDLWIKDNNVYILNERNSLMRFEIMSKGIVNLPFVYF